MIRLFLIALFLLTTAIAKGKDNNIITKADSLYNVAKSLLEKKNFEQAVKLYTESDNIYKKSLSTSDTLRLKATKGLVKCLIEYSREESSKGNIEKAGTLADRAEKIHLENFGKENEIYTEILNRKALVNNAARKYTEAIKDGSEAVKICKSLFGTEDERYALALYFLAHFHSSAGNKEEAIKHGEESVSAYRNSKNINKLNYAYALNNLAIEYQNKGTLQEALALIEEALPIFKDKLDANNITYARMLNNAAVIYSELHRNKEAIRIGEEATNAAKKVVGDENEFYLKCLNDLSTFYSNYGDNNKAIKLQSSQLKTAEKILGKNSPEFLAYRSNLASHIYDSGNYLSALELYMNNMESYIEQDMLESTDYALCLINIANCMHNLGDTQNAIKNAEEAKAIYRKHYSTEHPRYISLQINIAGYHSAIGDHPKAIEMTREILPTAIKVMGDGSYYHIWILNDLAIYYNIIGDNKTAIKIGEEALSKAKLTLNEKEKLYATLLSNLASFYDAAGNLKGAINISKEVLSIRKRTVGNKHPDYALTLNNLATYNYKNGDIEKALDYYIQALGIQAETSLIGYAHTLQNIADCFFELGAKDEAIKYTTESLREREKIYGKRHEEYAHSLFQLASYKLAAEDTIDFSSSFIELYDIRSQVIRDMFSKLTAKEREIYWQENNTFFEEDIPFVAHYVENQQLIGAAYNASLLTKGVLLDTELAMEQLLQESGDNSVVSLYKELKANRMLLDKLYGQPVADRKLSTDSLEILTNKQEQQLIKKSKAYGDYTYNMSITWRDVQKGLDKDEIAIEFKHFDIEQLKDIQYVAFILKKEYTSPKMITLFTQKELDAIETKEIYNTTTLCNKLWGAMATELQGVKNIYFAPTGSLHSIAIETLPIDTLYINEKYNIYRLSSTRELALIKEKNQIKNIALYGGLIYDANASLIEQENKKYKGKLKVSEQTIDTLMIRGGASYLPATLNEVDTINKLFKEINNISTSYYTGITGTEESFKFLGGKEINLLHIATHGFYWDENKTHWMKDKSFLNNISDNAGKEERALVRSGLLFSGANHALSGNPIKGGIDDGVLTAKELANIDFRKLNLAVLSACQSGLGDVTGEGVFGMQRGFKKAGARTLLMSLWTVDDKATAILMREFYHNLIIGKSKYEALRNAQKYLRNYQEVNEDMSNKKTKKYSSPYYWAAFVLLDAI